MTSFPKMARRICSPAFPVNSSTYACISAHTSAIGNGTRTIKSSPPTTSNLRLDLRSFLWYLFLTAALSFKRDSQPELYLSSGESRCFLFSTFN